MCKHPILFYSPWSNVNVVLFSLSILIDWLLFQHFFWILIRWMLSICYNCWNWMVKVATMTEHDDLLYFTHGINQISMWKQREETTHNIQWNQCHLEEICVLHFCYRFRMTTEFCYVWKIVSGPPFILNVCACMDLWFSNDMVLCLFFNCVVIVIIIA